jgi:hypothetical protein
MRKLIFPIMISAAILAYAEDKADERISDRKPLTVYFEQAQQRANHAHEELMSAQRKLKQALRNERTAADDLAAAQRKYEEAKRRSEAAVQASQAAQAEEAVAQERWSKEAASLRDAHHEMETGRSGK